MDNYLKFQIAAALVRDGAYKGDFDELTAALGDVYLGKRYRFGGAATPGLSPGSVNTPTLYATARVGVYAGFSNHFVDAGQVCIFVSDDGAEWTKYIILASGSGEPNYPLGPIVEYFTIEAKDAAVVKFYRSSYGESYGDFKVEASTDGGQTWTEVTATSEGAEVADLAAGEKVLLRGTNEVYGYNKGSNTYVNLANVHADGQCYVYGNIMSLIGGSDFAKLREVKDGGFAYFFSDFDKHREGTWVECKEGTKLVLPATTLGTRCYFSMFQGCTSLKAAPALPATTLAPSCYTSMFQGCTSLEVAPELPAGNLASYCYKTMFANCTGLKVAPALPATTLASFCYNLMFDGCTGLKVAPALPATTLAQACYAGMFQGCTGLKVAPGLPATTLAQTCYNSMFANCTNLAYIKALFTTTPGTTNTGDWVKGVKATGTFVKSAAATWNVSGDNGVPTGWTVETA